MILNFIFSHLNAITLGIWILVLILVAIRFFYPNWLKKLSYKKLIFIALGINIFLGLFITWGQYYVWANGSEMTKTLLTLPLPTQVSFANYLEWLRPLFQNHLGYFLFYVWGRIWFDIFLLFLTSGILYSLFVLWKFYRGGFSEKGPEMLLVLMLISGFPGVFISVLAGFVFAILLFVFSYIKNKAVLVSIEPAFIFSTFFALLFSRIILNMLQ